MTMEVLAWVAAVLVFACFFMKTIVPLRLFAIASNVAFIGYAALGIHEGIFSKVVPIFVLHIALLPLNIVRLSEVHALVKSVRGMQETDLPYDFLLPFLSRKRHAAGTVVFRKGEPAVDVFIVESGTVSLPDLGKLLGPSTLFGEVAVFSREAVRTAAATCHTDCELLQISGQKVLELFYQDRQFSFKIARLLAGYAR